MSDVKVGRLSNDDIEYIRENQSKFTVGEMAKALKKKPQAIRKCIQNLKGEVKKEIIQNAKKELKDEVFWRSITEQFTAQEVEDFQLYWANYLEQFDEDVNFSEKTQIVDLIKIRLLIDRNLSDRVKGKDQVEELSNQVQDYKDINGEPPYDDPVMEARYQYLVSQYRIAENSYSQRTQELKVLMDKHASYMEELKATRKQRYDQIKDTKKDWVNLIKNLRDEEYRIKEGRQVALMNLAIDKEYKRISEPHVYVDGTVDRPLLNAETVE